MEDYVLGVDLGGTKIAVLGSNRIGQNDAILRVPSHLHDYSRPIENTLIEAVESYIERYEDGVRPGMVGFGLKDYVDKSKGIWHAHPTAGGRVPLAFADLIRERCGLRAVLDNDVHAATLAEMEFGAGRKYRDFLYINVGTGLSMGAVIDGRLMRGASNYSGEAGHITVESDGEPCSFCGKRGCLENIASGGAIIELAMRIVQEQPDSLLAKLYEEKKKINSRDLFFAADQGDKAAAGLSERVLNALTVATADLINVFNPEAVVFGGGVMSDGWLIERLKRMIPERIIKTDWEALREITLSLLGSDQVGVLGAIVLARQELEN